MFVEGDGCREQKPCEHPQLCPLPTPTRPRDRDTKHPGGHNKHPGGHRLGSWKCGERGEEGSHENLERGSSFSWERGDRDGDRERNGDGSEDRDGERDGDGNGDKERDGERDADRNGDGDKDGEMRTRTEIRTT